MKTTTPASIKDIPKLNFDEYFSYSKIVKFICVAKGSILLSSFRRFLKNI